VLGNRGHFRVNFGPFFVSLGYGSLGLVRFEFEVRGQFRFPGFPVNQFLHFRRALFEV